MTRRWYAYVLFDGQTHAPFYVGKGCGYRWRRHFSEYCPSAPMRERVCLAGNVRVQIVGCETEDGAFALERSLIALIGRADLGDGLLINRTSGGQGCVKRRHAHSEETKAKIAERLRGRVVTPEHRERIGAANKGRTGPTAETKAKIAATQASLEYRVRMSTAIKATVTPEQLADMTERARQHNTGRPKSQAWKAAMSERMRGRVFSEDSRARMSAAQKRRYAK